MQRDPDDQIGRIRRSYGRGFADAARVLGIADVGALMNLAKIKHLEEGLNGQARKVYECVPISEPINLQQLVSACASSGKMGRPDYRIVESCAKDMVDQGLLKLTAEGKFQRVKPSSSPGEFAVKPELKIVETRPEVTPSPISQIRSKINEAINALGDIERLCSEIEAEGGKLQKLKDALSGLL